MLEVNIPGRESLSIKALVLDYNGTLAVDGVLLDGVREQIVRLAEMLEIYVLTSDTYGSVTAQCRSLPVRVHVLESAEHTQEKADFIAQLGQDEVAAVGNGANDRLMLERAALGIAVIGSEGAATAALMSSDIAVKDIRNALGLLLNSRRLVATLRR
ncbi:HAD family hydrolase [Paradesulfitobacterium aromaticivorans]